MSVDASTRGRRNRANGADYERRLANYMKRWWPDACRGVRNTYPDPGDIAEIGPALFVSMKRVEQERINPWMAELLEKAAGRLGLLIVRRKGHADPGEWWCWLTFHDLTVLMEAPPPGAYDANDHAHVRMELRDVMDLLVFSNYAPTPSGVAS